MKENNKESKKYKEEMKKALIELANNIDKFDIGIEVKPEINEFVNWGGEGIRTTRYTRIIYVRDKEVKEQKIKKDIW